MKRFGRYSTWVIAFIFLVALIAVYKTFDNFSSVKNFFVQLIDVLKPFIIGFVIAYLLSSPCKKVQDSLEKSKFGYIRTHKTPIGVGIVYLCAIAIIAIVLSFILPPLSRNIIDLWNNIPVFFESSMYYLKNLQAEGILNNLKLDEITLSNSIQKLLNSFDINSIGKYAQGFMGITSNVIDIFISIIVSIYMLLDSDTIKNVLKRIMSAFMSRKTVDSIGMYVRKINSIFSKFINCQLIDAVIVATLMTIILIILKVKYSLVLGIMIGCFNLIPYFGAIFACVVAVIITVFTGGFMKAVWVTVALIAMQQVDSNIIAPRIMENSLDIRPLWIIFAVTVGGGFFGIIGMLISVPVLAIIKTIFWDYVEYRENKKNKLVKESEDIK